MIPTLPSGHDLSYEPAGLEHLAENCRACLRAEVEKLKDALADYDHAADKFIEKVQSGRARSRETYADMLACRERQPLPSPPQEPT